MLSVHHTRIQPWNLLHTRFLSACIVLLRCCSRPYVEFYSSIPLSSPNPFIYICKLVQIMIGYRNLSRNINYLTLLSCWNEFQMRYFQIGYWSGTLQKSTQLLPSIKCYHLSLLWWTRVTWDPNKSDIHGQIAFLLDNTAQNGHQIRKHNWVSVISSQDSLQSRVNQQKVILLICV